MLSPRKVKVRSVLKLWSIFTLLSDLENLVIYFSSILLLFVNLISYYQALTFTHMIYVEITLSNENTFIATFALHLQCLFSSIVLHGMMQSFTDCIGFVMVTLAFLQCAFSNESSNCGPQQMQSHICCICLALPGFCAFSNVSSNWMVEMQQSHTGCICMTFRHCVFTNESSNCLLEWMQSQIGCISLTFLHCVFSDGSSNCLP